MPRSEDAALNATPHHEGGAYEESHDFIFSEEGHEVNREENPPDCLQSRAH